MSVDPPPPPVPVYQVIAEALARFRLEVEPVEKFQLVQVALESGRGGWKWPRSGAVVTHSFSYRVRTEQ